jgi:hypothetical protein
MDTTGHCRMSARPLFPLPPADGNLTVRQQHALDLLTATPEGLRSIDLGREIHIAKGCPYCSNERTCKYAHSAGEEVGRQLRRRDLAIKRKSGLWQLIRPVRDPDPGELPVGF